MPFENCEARIFSSGRQSWHTPQPEPIATAFGEPFCSTNRERAVISVLDCKLQQNLVSRPFLISASEDVSFFVEEIRPNLQPLHGFGIFIQQGVVSGD